MMALTTRHFFLVLAALLAVIPSPAAAIVLENGETLYGHITSAPSTDTYEILDVPAGATIFVSISEEGTLTGFHPYIKSFRPNGQNGGTAHGDFYAKLRLLTAMEGDWTIEVTRFNSNPDGGDYSITAIVIPGDCSIADGAAGGMMYPDVVYEGTIERGQLNYWTFSGIGNTPWTTLTLTATGGSGFQPWIQVQDGSGTNEGQTWTTTSQTLNIGSTVTNETYTVIVSKRDQNDVEGTYQLSVDNASLPLSANNDGKTNCCTGGAAVGDPINVATGNLFEEVTDYTTTGQNPLAFMRYYNSLSYTRNLYPTLLGINWRTNYDRYLRVLSASQAVAERPDGLVVNFTSAGGGPWTPDTDMDYELGSSGSTWTLTDHNDTVETYTETGGKGRLDSIALRNGYTQTLNYDSSGVLTDVSDTYGRSLEFSYSSGGVLSEVTTPDTLEIGFGYLVFTSGALLENVAYNTTPATELNYLYEKSELPYAMTGIIDENGDQFSSWDYDGAGRAISASLAGGADAVTISYISSGDATVTGPLGLQDTYSFSTLQNKKKLTQISRAASGSVAAAAKSFTYDSNGYQATYTDCEGVLTARTNNAHGNPTEITFASGSDAAQTTAILYSSAWTRLPAVITASGVTEELTYSSAEGNLLTRRLTDTTTNSTPYSTTGWQRTWTYTYTSTGLLTSVELPRNDVSAITTYDYTGAVLTKITDALSHETNILTYQSGGLPLTVEDPNGVVTTYSYNERNWLESSVLAVSAGNLATSYDYDNAGNLATLTLPDGSFFDYTYDSAHRLTAIENALGETQSFMLDDMGNRTQVLYKDSGGATKYQRDYTYDALGRVTADLGAENQGTTYTYDDNGNVLTITDSYGNVTTQTFDELNRLETFENAVGDESTIAYDSHNRVTSVTDPRGNETAYVYSGFADTIQIDSPDSGTSVMYFDSNGNRTQHTDAASAVTNMTYDALDRILTRTYPADSSLNVAFTYDENGHGAGILKLTSVTDEAGNLSQDWDQRGLLTDSVRTIGGDTYTTEYTYDSAGRMASITYASSDWLVSYSRDEAGQINYVSATEPGQSAVNLAADITYMPFGPVESFTYGNGVTHDRTYDQSYRVTSILDDAGASNIYYSSFTYDNNDNITAIDDNVTPANSQVLMYDSVDRLVFASGSYGAASSITYDSNSNRLTYGATTYTYAGDSNRLTSAGGNAIGYIATGNINAIGSDSMTYNKANRLASATVSGTTSTYTYDAFGKRVEYQVGLASPVVQQYDQDRHLLIETGNNETNYAWLEDMPLATINPATAAISALHTDHLGTPQAATNSSKSVVWTGAYEPFGAVSPSASVIMNLRFPGQYADDTWFYHNGLRDYIPAYGRYLQSDPTGLSGGLNTYNYALNNPFRYTDPTGTQAVPYVCLFAPQACIIIGGSAVLVGGGIYVYSHRDELCPGCFAAAANENDSSYCTREQDVTLEDGQHYCVYRCNDGSRRQIYRAGACGEFIHEDFLEDIPGPHGVPDPDDDEDNDQGDDYPW